MSLITKLTAIVALALSLTGAALAQELPPPPPGAPPALPAPPPAPPAQSRCTVPSLKGLSLAAATRKLSQAGCRLGKVTKAAARGAAPGTVLRQSARAGTRLPVATRIGVVVARGRI
jgi:hypothetical protein